MRSKTFALASLLAASAVLVTGVASAAPAPKTTGGGQVLVGSKGAGDTIAFTAQGGTDGVKGQIQYVDREVGSGKGQTVYHGQPACLDVVGNVAKVAGTWGDGGTFQLYVEDNGEGKDATDVVTLMQGEPATCDFDEPEDEDKVALARGNAQVHQ